MATKDNYLFLKADSNGHDFDNQNNNLNLNQNPNRRSVFFEPLKTKKIDERKDQNYAVLETENDSRAKKYLNSWNKNDKNLASSSFLHKDHYPQEKDEFKNSNSAKNSTLSLHIAAYQNLYEDTSDSDGGEKEVIKNEEGKKNLFKKWKNAKQFFTGSSSNIKNPFEFTRQQNKDQFAASELMQFRASQRLLNPKKLGALSAPENENREMNIGLLGHVDAGKTTLSKALSTIASTASFDKGAKASNLRANTIDLGFSAIELDSSHRIALIDCPGHAQLIKAVLAASSVFDGAIIVINASRGIEPQTAEHLISASILCPNNVIIVISKIDLVEKEKIEMMKKKLPKLLKSLNIPESSPIVPLNLSNSSSESVIELTNVLKQKFYLPERISSGSFVMVVDHCFPIKGKGTVMTGTVVDGSCKIGTEVFIPMINETRKIKEIQSWKQKVQDATMGQRAALLFSNLPETEDIDRTIIFSPGSLTKAKHLLITVSKIEQFKYDLKSASKIHVSIGFETLMAECNFLKECGEKEFEQEDGLNSPGVSHALLELQKPIFVKGNDICLAAKLDSQKPTECRFAFYGRISKNLNSAEEIKRFRRKQREGYIDRIEADNISLICVGLFKKETNLQIFNGMSVRIGEKDVGKVENAFGKSGKVRISVLNGISEDTKIAVKNGEKVKVLLKMKKFIGSNKVVEDV